MNEKKEPVETVKTAKTGTNAIDISINTETGIGIMTHTMDTDTNAFGVVKNYILYLSTQVKGAIQLMGDQIVEETPNEVIMQFREADVSWGTYSNLMDIRNLGHWLDGFYRGHTGHSALFSSLEEEEDFGKIMSEKCSNCDKQDECLGALSKLSINPNTH